MSSRRTITRGRRNRASKLPVVEEPQFDQKRDEPQGGKFRKSKNSPAGPSHGSKIRKSKNSPAGPSHGTKPEEQNLSASPPHKGAKAVELKIATSPHEVKPETVAVPSLKTCVLQEVSIEGMDYSDFFKSPSDGSMDGDSLHSDDDTDSMEDESLPSDDDADCYDFLGVMLDPPGFGAPRF